MGNVVPLNKPQECGLYLHMSGDVTLSELIVVLEMIQLPLFLVKEMPNFSMFTRDDKSFTQDIDELLVRKYRSIQEDSRFFAKKGTHLGVMDVVCNEMDSLAVSDVRSTNSIDLMISSMSVAAIFGLQEYSLIKDIFLYVASYVENRTQLARKLVQEGPSNETLKTPLINISFSEREIAQLAKFKSVEIRTEGDDIFIKLNR